MKFKKNKEIIKFENYKRRKCPFISKLLSDCHCSDMRSMKVEEAIYYCGGNYAECPVYGALKKKNDAAPAAFTSSKVKMVNV